MATIEQKWRGIERNMRDDKVKAIHRMYCQHPLKPLKYKISLKQNVKR